MAKRCWDDAALWDPHEGIEGVEVLDAVTVDEE